MNKRIIIKIFALFLALALFVSIAGCNSKSNNSIVANTVVVEGESVPDGDSVPDDGFRVGYGRTDIMPEDPIPLGSYGNSLDRVSTGYLNQLYFSCIALTDDEDTTMLLMTYDITQPTDDVLNNLKNYASEKYGIDKNYVHLSGTHTHSSVDLSLDVKVVNDYKVKLYLAAHEAIDLAMADRKKATIYAGETQTEGLNFVRHYLRSDGTIAGDNYTILSTAPVIKHYKDPDSSMRLIKFCRENSKGEKVKDIVMMNWQAHNHLTGGFQKTDISADFTGACREYMEEKKDCYFNFFQGCAGNLNEQSSYFPELNRTTDFNEYGKLLAGYALDVYDKLDSYKTGKIKSTEKDFVGPAIHRFDSKLDNAREIISAYNAAGKNESAIKDLCIKYGLTGSICAKAIINRSTKDKTVTMPVYAYSIGDDIGFASAPVEFFDVLGQQIRKGSPYKLTFSQGYTDGSTFGYMPSSDLYDYGCYEVCNSKFEQGAGEMCADQLISMLKDLHN